MDRPAAFGTGHEAVQIIFSFLFSFCQSAMNGENAMNGQEEKQ
jgi:hypothetical protein